MTYPSLAIIGTAGRGEDKNKLTQLHYTRMIGAAGRLIDHLKLDNETLKLVSGGAAWADHIVVTLGLTNSVNPKNIELFLPCELDRQQYRGDSKAEQKTADTANYYHREFCKTTQHNGLWEINKLYELGGVLHHGNGNFHARNAQVAKAVSPDGVLLAFTFGSGETDQKPWSIRFFTDPKTTAEQAGLKDGGTAHTFGIARCLKAHCILGPIGENDVWY